MAKVVAHDAKLDGQLERYLRVRPLAMKDIVGYAIVRRSGDVTRVTIDAYIDHSVFDQEEESSNG